jgi:hypothetical protein
MAFSARDPESWRRYQPMHRKCSGIGRLLCGLTLQVAAAEPEWNPANIRGALIHEVEVFPFVTLPSGLGDGSREGSGQ